MQPLQMSQKKLKACMMGPDHHQLACHTRVRRAGLGPRAQLLDLKTGGCDGQEVVRTVGPSSSALALSFPSVRWPYMPQSNRALKWAASCFSANLRDGVQLSAACLHLQSWALAGTPSP